MLFAVKHNEKYIPRGIYRSLVSGMWNFPDFAKPKQAPINAFYYVCYPPPVDVQTSPTLVHGAKVVNYFGLSKKIGDLVWFFVTSDAACWKAILISLCSNEFSNIPPKLQSRNAAHTTVHSFFFKKTVTPFAIAFRKHNYERVPIVLRNAILDRWVYLFWKKTRLTCVFAFFVVTL